MRLHKLDEAIRAICPIDGLDSNGNISFKDEATTQQRADAQALVAATPIDTPADLATEVAENDAINQLLLNSKADAGYAVLQNATLAQINTFINAHFASTDAQGRGLLKLLAAVASIYLREK